MAERRDPAREQRINQIINERLELIEEELANARLMNNEIRERRLIEEQIAEYRGISKDDTKEISKYNKNTLDHLTKSLRKNKEHTFHYGKHVGSLYIMNRLFRGMWRYLMENDKVIKSTTLNLGLSGQKAEQLRLSFEASAGFAARLGGTMQDLQVITEGYADQTGRARVLSEEMLNSIMMMAKGTAMSTEEATKLAGKFELMGISAVGAANYVQGVVDTSERMGVNTARVLRNIEANFKRLQTYTFRQGVVGFSQMATYAEKMRIDMTQALDAAEHARTLENAVDLAAQLQVMGGEFARTDPFQLLFLARNDPAQFTKKINEMTRSVVTFRRTSDDTWEKFISPADMDRLRAVEKSLGFQRGELIEQSLRMADIQRMRQEMARTGLTPADREVVEGIAHFNEEAGRFQVHLGRTVKNISDLNTSHMQQLRVQEETLESRAMAAMTFDEALKATIEEVKTVLLPILRGVNTVLAAVRPYVIRFNEWITNMDDSTKNFLIGAGKLMAGAVILTKTVGLFVGGITVMKGLLAAAKGVFVGRGAAGVGGRMAGEVATRGRAVPTTPTQRPTRGMRGVGIGAGALGAGAGIGVAAMGITQLATAMQDMDVEQMRAFNVTLGAMALNIAAIALAGKIGIKGMLAAALGITAIGGAVRLAAPGIVMINESLSKLIETSIDAGPAMLKVGAGIGAISASLIGMGALFGPTIVGAAVLTRTLSRISRFAPELREIGDAFKEINVAMQGDTEDFQHIIDSVKALSQMKIREGTMFAELRDLFQKPLRVKFDDTEVNMVSNITLEMDGHKIIEKNIRHVAELQQDIREGRFGTS